MLLRCIKISTYQHKTQQNPIWLIDNDCVEVLYMMIIDVLIVSANHVRQIYLNYRSGLLGSSL